MALKTQSGQLGGDKGYVAVKMSDNTYRLLSNEEGYALAANIGRVSSEVVSCSGDWDEAYLESTRVEDAYTSLERVAYTAARLSCRLVSGSYEQSFNLVVPSLDNFSISLAFVEGATLDSDNTGYLTPELEVVNGI